jgi:hypothetical protein
MKAAAVVLILVANAAPVNAQGHGHSHNPHTGPPASQQSPSGTGVRAFGVWLDDASVMPQGSGWVSVSIGHWRTALFRQTDVPTIDGGYGLASRVQVGGSMPFYHATDMTGAGASSGLGDVYLNAKFQLRAPNAQHAVGFALIPVVEILGEAAPDGSRMHWALPGSIEIQQQRFRAYGTAGYFSRGSLFASAALDVPVSSRVVAFGSVTHSYSARPDPLAVAMGLNQQRSDVTGGATYVVTPSATVFGSVGRTISRQDPTSATLAVNVGVSLTFERKQSRH